MNKDLKKKKEALQRELEALNEQEEKAMIEKHYPAFKKKFEGKYFKSSNGYTSSETWVKYTKVTHITPDDIYDTRGNGVTSYFKGWSFETTSAKDISIEQERRGYVHGLDKEITEKEFYAAWNKIIEKINGLQ